ncbi:MAG: membrane-bound PQQ-dependent dehydrogenase, glucose/quinate/shikimate family, partial [Rhizobium sp.]
MRAPNARSSFFWFACLLGIVVFLIGLTLAAGGLWLSWVGGSWYYFLSGLALLIAGFLIGIGRISGAWIYLAIYICTLAWALWEVGLDGWALVPRTIAPTVLLVFIVAALPGMSATVSRRTAMLGAILVVIAATGAGFAIHAMAPREPAQPLPAANASGMQDPSLLQIGDDWPAYGGTYAARRFSPLDQITAANAGELKRVWIAHTGDLPSSAAKKTYGAETTPLKIGDTLYLCSAKNIIIALDAATGKEKWRHDPKVSDEYIPYTAACRGLDYYPVPNASLTDPCAARIIEGTLDARLIAVDAKTGEPCHAFGTDGQVDTGANMGDDPPGMLSITSAPTIVRGVIVTGHQVLDGQKRDAPSGVIEGFDAVTGQMRWAWDMKQPDRSGPPPQSETYSRGTPNMWTTASGDEKLGLVYLPLGSAAVDYWSSSRSDLEKQWSTS